MDASPASPQPFPASQHSPGWPVLVPARGQGGFNGTFGAVLLAPSCPHRSDPSGSGWRMPHLAPPQRAGICPRSAPLPAQHPALRAGDTPTPQHPGGVIPTGSSSSGPGHTARGQGAARGRDVQGSEHGEWHKRAGRKEVWRAPAPRRVRAHHGERSCAQHPKCPAARCAPGWGQPPRAGSRGGAAAGRTGRAWEEALAAAAGSACAPR